MPAHALDRTHCATSRLAAIGLLAALLTCSSAPNDGPVHVVLFLVDTLRADRLGAYGYGRPTSPAIDAIAAEGIVFEQASAPAPWTLPSTVSLMTSRYPCEHGVLRDGQRLPREIPTLAERLQQAGYATQSFFANPYAGPFSGLHRGFGKAQSTAQTTGDDIGRWLDQRDPTQPFFLYIHNSEPHDPYDQPAALQAQIAAVSEASRTGANALLDRYRQLGRADWDRRQPIGTTDNTQQQRAALRELEALAPTFRDLYDGAVRQADEQIANVVAALEARGLWDDTLFIVLSDHGEEFGEHGGWQHDQSVYEELLRVPFVVKLPHGELRGRRIAEPVALLDVMPTVLEAVGHPERAAQARGRSLLGLARGDDAPDRAAGPRIGGMRDNRKKFYAPGDAARGDINLALRQGTLKGIWNHERERLELYDLALDPAEQRDLAADRPDLVATWSHSARDFLDRCTPEGAALPAAALDETDAALLRRLGYLPETEAQAEGSMPSHTRP